jgi:hypothetical protein
MIYISLGCCCEITYVLKALGKSKELYPFDFITSYDVEDVIMALNNNFRNMEKLFTDNGQLRNGYYSSCLIPHYTEKEWNEKLQRRITRFNELVNCNEFILFIRKSHVEFNKHTFHPPGTIKSSYTNQSQAMALCESLKKYTNNFKLLVINECKSPDDKWEHHPDIIQQTIITDNIWSCDIKSDANILSYWRKLIADMENLRLI